MDELQTLLREQRVVVAGLRATAQRLTAAVRATPIKKSATVSRLLLLQMAESLVTAHKAAKIDDDGLTLDLIEDAMRHVGKRLEQETTDDQFKRISTL